MPSMMIDVPQMIDLALGTPEIGVVNFNVLHALLHIITNNLKLNSARVEFRGVQCKKIENLIKTIPIDPIIEITEYSVENETEEDGYKNRIKKEKTDFPVDTIIVVSKTGDLENDEDSVNISRKCKNPPGFPLKPITMISTDDFREMGSRNESIHDLVSNILPDNRELISSSDGTNPIAEMICNLNMTKRIESLEIGTEKLTTIISDLAKEYTKMEKITSEMDNSSGDLKEIKDQLDNIRYSLHSKKILRSKTPERKTAQQDQPGATNSGISPVPSIQFSDDFVMSSDFDKFKIEFKKLKKELDSLGEQLEDADIISRNMFAPTDDVSEATTVNTHGDDQTIDPTDDQTSRDVSVKSDNKSGKKAHRTKSDKNCCKCCKKPCKKLQTLECSIIGLERQIFNLQKDMAEVFDRLECGTLFNNSGQQKSQSHHEQQNQINGIDNLYSNLEGVKVDLESIMEQVGLLVIDQDTTNGTICKFDETINQLLSAKVDREEIEDLLAEKADYNLLQKKVSCKQFDATKKDLSEALCEAINQLNKQQQQWKTTTDDILLKIESKLDKTELSPLEEQINGKFQAIQGRVKELASIERTPEAAGTKTKFLRDVNCISCDHEAIMRLEEPHSVPKQDAIYPKISMKPFLSYDLDNVRKEMKNLENSKNLLHFEVLNNEKKIHNLKQPYLCARYSGGSHTKISAKDRVEKTKFKRNWGGAPPTVSDFLIQGNDGTLYKGAAPKCECNPECCSNKCMTCEKVDEAEILKKVEIVADDVDVLQPVDETNCDGLKNFEINLGFFLIFFCLVLVLG